MELMKRTELQQKLDKLMYGLWNGLHTPAIDQLLYSVRKRAWCGLRTPIHDQIVDQVRTRVIAELNETYGDAYEGGRPGPRLNTAARDTLVRLVRTGTYPLTITRHYKSTGKYISIGTLGHVLSRRWSEDNGVYQYIVKFEGYACPRCIEEAMIELWKA